MKIISLFTKAPQHKRFTYSPRYYNELEEEQKLRERRIRADLESENNNEREEIRMRIAGSFRSAKISSKSRGVSSPGLLRLGILTFLSISLIGFIQFGTVALYGLFLLVPFYFFLKFKGARKR